MFLKNMNMSGSVSYAIKQAILVMVGTERKKRDPSASFGEYFSGVPQ